MAEALVRRRVQFSCRTVPASLKDSDWPLVWPAFAPPGRRCERPDARPSLLDGRTVRMRTVPRRRSGQVSVRRRFLPPMRREGASCLASVEPGSKMRIVTEWLGLGVTAPAEFVPLFRVKYLRLLPVPGLVLFVRDDYLYAERHIPRDDIRSVLGYDDPHLRSFLRRQLIPSSWRSLERALRKTYRLSGTACAEGRHFRAEGLGFPRQT